MSDFDWRSVAQSVAPLIATALGGPLAGMAATVIGRVVLGRGDTDPTTVEEAQAAVAACATPDDLVRLREAEAVLRQMEIDQNIKFAELTVQDRADARERETKTGDRTTSWLAKIVLGYFASVSILILLGVYMVLTGDLAITSDTREVALFVVGMVNGIYTSAVAAVMMILSYYFGTTLSSSSKNETISRLSK